MSDFVMCIQEDQDHPFALGFVHEPFGLGELLYCKEENTMIAFIYSSYLHLHVLHLLFIFILRLNPSLCWASGPREDVDIEFLLFSNRMYANCIS